MAKVNGSIQLSAKSELRVVDENISFDTEEIIYNLTLAITLIENENLYIIQTHLTTNSSSKYE